MASKRAEDYIDSKIKPKVAPTVSGVVGGLSRMGQAPLPKLNPAPATTTSYVGGRSLPAKTTAPANNVSKYVTQPKPQTNTGTGMTRDEIMALPTGNSLNKTKDSTGGDKDFDTNALYQSVLNAKKALLESNYNSYLNELNKAYETNMLGYDTQRTDLGRKYEESIEGIQDNTYRNIEAGKVNATQRGIMNSNMGLALGQASMRAGAEQQSYATQQRNDLLNEINAQINNLTKGFNNDKLTAQTNYGLGQTQALNEALQTKLGADMNIWQQNDQQEFLASESLLNRDFTSGENALSRSQQEMLARLQMENALKVAGIGAGSAANQLAWAKEMYGMEREDSNTQARMNFLTNLPGFDGSDKLGLFDGPNSESARNVGTMQELMKLSGFSPSEVSNYTNQYFTTNARKYGDSFANFLQSILGPK